MGHCRALLTQLLAGAVMFRAACNMGLEGIVAKRRDSGYRSGRSRDWIKIKNITHPAIDVGQARNVDGGAAMMVNCADFTARSPGVADEFLRTNGDRQDNDLDRLGARRAHRDCTVLVDLD